MIPRPVTPGSEIDSAGGAYVRRRFELGGREVTAGDVLSAEEVGAIPRANLHSLVNLRLIELFPRAPMPEGTERFVVKNGNSYNIVEGRVINDEPLTLAQANARVKN